MQLEFFHPKYWLLWIGLGLLRMLMFLPYPAIMFLGKQLGILFYFIAKYRRHIIQTNIALCFPELSAKEKTQLIKENFIQMGYTLVENPLCWWGSERQVLHRSTIIGLEHLQTALDNKHGVLLLSAHFAALEIGGRITSNEIPLTFMYRQHKNKLFEWFQRKSREGQSDGMIERKEVRATIKALRNQKPVWYAADQDYGRKHSVFAPFFGVSAATITATSDFAKLGKAVVIPFFTYRKKDASGYIIELLAPIEHYPSNNPIKDATRVNKIFETAIKKAPEQYLWAHRRFKTRPESEPNLYQ
ncbi:MAG: LpxL/LpxP family Kdo(2)-lipid IV(A) lauroyl/palmitoleoyl acyltransferase [Gammaproteobacteria bacterium]|nr:LpxL/LpxP family Kdo(2)-lipid IV(A) lauroyl/palmitoleoyl acyltransferase [Gammaproteobacteria bacterium]